MKSGQEITTFKPNIPDKIANVLAGTVDLTARVVAEGDRHYMSFKTSETIFGGSRYNFGVQEIPLDYDTFIETMVSAQKNAHKDTHKDTQKDTQKDAQKDAQKAVESASEGTEVKAQAESRPKRTRKVKGEE